MWKAYGQHVVRCLIPSGYALYAGQQIYANIKENEAHAADVLVL